MIRRAFAIALVVSAAACTQDFGVFEGGGGSASTVSSGASTCSEACDDPRPCYDAACVGGACQPVASPAGSPCGNGLTCDGEGNCAGCTQASDCGQDGPCGQHACEGGVCSVVDAGEMVSDGVDGNCTSIACVAGAVTGTPTFDDGDAPQASEICQLAFCDEAASPPAQIVAADAGTACGADEVCTGDGVGESACVTCVDDVHCTGQVCDGAANECVDCYVDGATSPGCDDPTLPHCNPSGASGAGTCHQCTPAGASAPHCVHSYEGPRCRPGLTCGCDSNECGDHASGDRCSAANRCVCTQQGNNNPDDGRCAHAGAAGSRCVASSNTQCGCEVSGDCTGKQRGAVCNTTTNRCGCANNGDCPIDGFGVCDTGLGFCVAG